MRFSFFLRVLFAETHTDAGNRNAHFQQAVIDAGMSSILWVSYLVQRQVGGDDRRLSAAVSAVHDAVDLFQCVFGATLHAEVVNDEQGIAAELVHDLISSGKAAVQLVQDSGEVRHTHRHLLLHQSVCNAPGKETLASTNTAPEEQPKVLCTHGLPLLYITMCMVHLRATAIVVFKGPVQHCRIREASGFQPPHKVNVFLLVDKGFLLCPLNALAVAFDGVLAFAHQDNALCKECFFWGVTFSAIKQTIFAVMILGVFGNTGNGLIQNSFNRLYRLSPSLNV